MTEFYIVPPRKTAQSLDSNTLNSTYLRLDASNGPLLGKLDMGEQVVQLGLKASDPSSPSGGQIYWNTTSKTIRVYVDGVTTWQSLTVMPSSTQGGIFYGTSGGTAWTAAGTLGQVLKSNGVNPPTWMTITDQELNWAAPVKITYDPSGGAFATYNKNYGLYTSGTPRATADGALVQFGHGAWDGTAGAFAGSASGTVLGINVPTAFGGNIVDIQENGVSYLKVTATNSVTIGASSTTIGLYGVTPVARVTGYNVTNAETDRSYDADATTVTELANVLGTLIADLKNTGIIG